ncbi:hypothetical protein F2Q69_00050258 [Brassica cretica]|uniref:DUF1985 domain-containing protein n=1 Tax=Brassica cretica TaxID=69181 RepID=A0A8S9PTP4_BRACR|nr:hypothetical protein F2Q69_00050258 [Brassica cretica]
MTKKKAKKKPTATLEPDPPQDASGSLQPDLRLPPRLFATDRFPTKRLNIYSSPEILPFLRHLLCLPKNTLWSVFGGNPLRYGLQEFGTVTGLNCASFPEGYHPNTAKSVVAGKDEIWKRLFGKKKIQDSFRLQGFPLTLQLVAFRAIPQLLSFIPAQPDQRTLMDLEDGYLPQHNFINSLNIRRVEFSSDLAVSPIIPIESQPQSGWGEWPNDPKDDCVIYMEQLIVDHFTFNKGMWPAGVTTEPLLKKPKDRGHRNEKVPTRVKQSLKPKKVIEKETSSRKQRRISSKNPATSHQVGQEAPIDQDAPDTSHHSLEPEQVAPLDDDPPTDQDVDAMETDEHPASQSPIISEYAVHLQRQASASLNTPLETTPNESPPRTPSCQFPWSCGNHPHTNCPRPY